MKTKQSVCNDCGCRFEIKDAKASVAQAPGKEKVAENKTKPGLIACPECRSYNITTA